MYPVTNIYSNPITNFNRVSYMPNIMPTSFVHPQASVTGNVFIDHFVNIAPFASIRGDEGTPIHIGKSSNIQDSVTIHGLKDKFVNHNNRNYSVFIGDNVSLAHQCQVHGPAKIGNNVFIGMQSFIFKSNIGNNVVIEPGAKVIGVDIPSDHYVPAGEVIKTPEQAAKLPAITPEYQNKELNHEVVEVNKQLANGYLRQLNSYPNSYYLPIGR